MTHATREQRAARGEGNRLDALARLATAGWVQYWCEPVRGHWFVQPGSACTLPAPTYREAVDRALRVAQAG